MRRQSPSRSRFVRKLIARRVDRHIQYLERLAANAKTAGVTLQELTLALGGTITMFSQRKAKS